MQLLHEMLLTANKLLNTESGGDDDIARLHNAVDRMLEYLFWAERERILDKIDKLQAEGSTKVADYLVARDELEKVMTTMKLL